MKKLSGVFLATSVLLFSSISAMAEYRVEQLSIDKIAIVDNLAVVTLPDQSLENQDACTSTTSGHQAVVDLENNTQANYLYTHLMTAMVSNKPVHLVLDGCVAINEIDSLPSITAAEIIH